MNEPVFVRFISLGCAKNFVDTEVMAASLAVDGVGLTDDPKDADVTVVNTCAFIPPARAEAISRIKEALAWKAKAPRARKVIVSGCLPQWDKDGKARDGLPGVDLWLGPDESPRLGARVRELFSVAGQAATPAAVVRPAASSFLYDHTTPRLQLTPPHYAYIKIAEGCDNYCSYCSIPSIRGRLRCRSLESVVTEARNLLANGVKELILIAQDTTAFGAGGGPGLPELLRRLDAFDGDYWVRVHYLHPRGITDELIDVFAAAKHVLRYVDIPLQHISERMLKAMNRKVGPDRVRELVRELRGRIPGIAIRTTFIVGFPGEADDDFAELADFVEQSRFERVGVFTYHPEPGTPAASMPDHVSKTVAESRAKAISETHKRNSLRINRSLEGDRIDVIVDSAPRAGKYVGRTYMDSPDIDNTVEIASRRILAPGDLLLAEVTGVSPFALKVKVASNNL